MAPASEEKLQAATEALTLCKELIETDAGEILKPVVKTVRLAETLLDPSHSGEAMRAATEALAETIRLKTEHHLSSNTHIAKPQGSKALLTGKSLLKLARESGDRRAEAFSLKLLADVHVCYRETAKALKLAQEGVSILKQLPDKRAEAVALVAVVNAHLAKIKARISPMLDVADKGAEKVEALRRQRDLEAETALETAREACTIYHTLDDARKEAETLTKIAEVHLAKLEPDETKMIAREVKYIYQDIGDVHGEVIALNLIVAASLARDEDVDEALVAAKDVVRLFKGPEKKIDGEDKKATADALHGYAKVAVMRGLFQDALDAAEESLKLYQDIGVKRNGTAVALGTVAQIYFLKKDREMGLKAATEAVDVFREVGDRAGEAGALHTAGLLDMENLHAELGDNPKATFTQEHSNRLEEAWKPLTRALDIFREMKNADGEAMVSQTVSDMMAKAQKLQEAISEPTKTIYYLDPATGKSTVQKFFDAEPADNLALKDAEAAKA